MMSDKEIINKLNDMLDNLANTTLKNQGKTACAKELSRLRGTFNQVANHLSQDINPPLTDRTDNLFEITDTIEEIILQINLLEKTKEKELHGIEYYSIAEEGEVNDCGYKAALRNELVAMLRMIYDARPNLR